MTEHFPKATAGANPQIQEAQRTPSRRNATQTASWQIIFKLQKIKDEQSRRGNITLPIGGFPGSLAGKEATCNAGDPGSIPGLGRSAGEGTGYPLQYSWASLGGSEGKESACNVVDLGSVPGLRRSPREGHGNPLQYSCLENPKDRGA